MKQNVKIIIKKCFPFLVKFKKNILINRRLREIRKWFKKNWAESNININTIGYKIILIQHSLEKGMTSKNPRYFGIQKVDSIIDMLKIYEDKKWDKDFAYELGYSILFKYTEYYEKNGWTDRDEYKKVKKFINGKECNVPSGVMKIKKEDILKDAIIDYDRFFSSRHSCREFSTNDGLLNDVKKAVEIAIKTPSACNRQMCKIYNVVDEKTKREIFKYSHGLTGFDNDTVNIFVITYDISSLCFPDEIQQGMFNAGLFSMNFVTALHSFGIGSCFLEYGNNIREEKEHKKILEIPENEKIAVVIAYGYYPNETIIPCSTRKPLEEIYRER